MHIPDECVTKSSGQRITAKEHNKTFVVVNPTGRIVCRVKVDGCVVTDSLTPRCDYLFEVGAPPEEALYVELKGNDVKRACEQLSSALDLFADRHRNIPRRCFVVASGCPAFNAKKQALMRKFRRDHKATIKFKSNQMEVRV